MTANRTHPIAGRISPHFSWPEFACPCCFEVQIDPWLILGLELLRGHIGLPIHINSGFRCPANNARVGGSPRSQHLAGRAADIRVTGLSPLVLAAAAETVPAFRDGGIGVYSDQAFVHVDARNGRARWAFHHGHAIDYDALMNETRSSL